jgi:hypothetical protein
MSSVFSNGNSNWTVTVTGWLLIAVTMLHAARFGRTKSRSGKIAGKSNASEPISEETKRFAGVIGPATRIEQTFS